MAQLDVLFIRTAWKVSNELENLVGVGKRESNEDHESERLRGPDRAKLAHLRKGLTTSDGWHPAVAVMLDQWIPEDIREWDTPPFYQAASLFALHPESHERQPGEKYGPPFTVALHQYAQEQGQKSGRNLEDAKRPFDRRVMTLLNANEADRFTHLRRLVHMLKGTDIQVDWCQLIIDLHYWDSPQRTVQRRWSRAWWPAPRWITPSDSDSTGASSNGPPLANTTQE